MFHMVVDDKVYTYISCRSICCKTIKVFDYIQPRAFSKSAAAISTPRCSTSLNPSGLK